MYKNELILPVAILVASFALGGFIYASQVSKQESIGKQQGIKIQEEKELGESRRKQLENCLEIATQENKRKITAFVEIYNKNCANDVKVRASDCSTAIAKFFPQYDNEEKIDREECYKRYPQK